MSERTAPGARGRGRRDTAESERARVEEKDSHRLENKCCVNMPPNKESTVNKFAPCEDLTLVVRGEERTGAEIQLTEKTQQVLKTEKLKSFVSETSGHGRRMSAGAAAIGRRRLANFHSAARSQIEN
ncbi:hypothetical protein EVAR_83370_1 [Eumeta japonica]|uniref:Uncharacterized protein n=1 Tax=Eumeta variegata TaxID=151549 RepID=A0A4C1TYQ1_EUMVA|nr:hypothetical protein EVAR_83370_1 [Eumeta japonica]